MEWISINDMLPEDYNNELSSHIQKDEWDKNEYVECLVHTNFGYMVTKRCHSVDNIVFEYEPNILGSKRVDNGWYWYVEIGNSIKEHPIYVDYWCFITEIPKNKK